MRNDRFLCIDDDVYHIGASIKDLGKKWFGFLRWRCLHQMNWWKESTGNKKKSELSIEYGRTFQILFGEYYYSSYRYRLTLSMATLCKASQDFLPNPL